jgi:hypothetical protein
MISSPEGKPMTGPTLEVHVPTWAQAKIWPGWEREAFVEWIEGRGGYSTQPWVDFAEWWRVEGMWR